MEVRSYTTFRESSLKCQISISIMILGRVDTKLTIDDAEVAQSVPTHTTNRIAHFRGVVKFLGSSSGSRVTSNESEGSGESSVLTVSFSFEDSVSILSGSGPVIPSAFVSPGMKVSDVLDDMGRNDKARVTRRGLGSLL